MTTEAQKLALLEWAGWRSESGFMDYDGEKLPWTVWTFSGITHNSPPNLSSLDVLAEFEGKLKEDNSLTGKVAFRNKLMNICGSHAACVHATAPQRLEALVRTLGLWREE